MPFEPDDIISPILEIDGFELLPIDYGAPGQALGLINSELHNESNHKSYCSDLRLGSLILTY